MKFYAFIFFFLPFSLSYAIPATHPLLETRNPAALAWQALCAQTSYLHILDRSKLFKTSLTEALPNQTPTTRYLDWKTGDGVHYYLYISTQQLGWKHQEVIKEDQDHVWLQDKTWTGYTLVEVVNVLRRVDGKVLKTYVNGTETIPMPIPKLTIISEEELECETRIGTFNCLHRTLKDESGISHDFWSNTESIPLSGILKSSNNHPSYIQQMHIVGYRFRDQDPVGIGFGK